MTQSQPAAALDHLRVLDLTNGLGQMRPHSAGPGDAVTHLKAREAEMDGTLRGEILYD